MNHHIFGMKNKLRPIDFRSGFGIRPGYYHINGASIVPGGVSFTIQSQSATGCELLLFKRHSPRPYVVIPFPENYKIGNVYSMIVFGLEIDKFEYAFRFDGPYDPAKGLLFDPTQPILDPYAKAVTGQSCWGIKPWTGKYPYRARVVSSDFDWGAETNPRIPLRDLVIYELHVRGFTRDMSSGVTAPGTFLGLREKIPYLKELGINAVELMPVFEFDEMNDVREFGGQQLLDYWGYNPISFFAPNTAYTSGLEFNREGDELKSLIRELHHNGIEVFLDVVFNHTAEGGSDGRTINFKGMDNDVYYILDPKGEYYNFSGCGNTVNCNHPIVRDMILNALRHWATEFRIDGFRFDLASILARDENGAPLQHPPLLESLARDPILANVKLIAEAWDAGGMYQVGSFPAWRRWSEWNGRYRDDMRRFLKGDGGLVETVAKRVTGSPDLYDLELRGLDASINFITCHDGFTLNDLYTYSTKHNLINGWNNTDGENNNNSWNCGIEGETDDPQILKLRERMVRNAFVALLCSRGTPMFLAGDEFGNTQYGNNNAYCQDNRISWLDWNLLETQRELFDFVKNLIRLRKEHDLMRHSTGITASGYPEITFHGRQPFKMDREHEDRYLGIMYAGPNSHDDEFIYLAMNMHWEPVTVQLPVLPPGYVWHEMVNTSQSAHSVVHVELDTAPVVDNSYLLGGRVAALLIGSTPAVPLHGSRRVSKMTTEG